MKRNCKHRHKLVLCKLLLNDVICFSRCPSKSGSTSWTETVWRGGWKNTQNKRKGGTIKKARGTWSHCGISIEFIGILHPKKTIPNKL